MPEGVPVVEDGAESRFLLVDAHDFGLDLAAAENHVLERVVVAVLDGVDVAFKITEEFLVVDDAVLHDFGEACEVFGVV